MRCSTISAIDRVALVDSSLGGRVAVNVCLVASERVWALAMVGAGRAGWDWADELRRARAEEDATAAGDLDWAVELGLPAHARSDGVALDEIAHVLRAPEWHRADDMPYVAELVRLTGRDTVEPVTPDDQIDWR